MKFVCSVCGYVYDDDAQKVKFETLPDGWTCPLCGAPKALFNKEENETKPEAAPVEVMDEDVTELSFGQLAALCSNLARGCRKQYKEEEARQYDAMKKRIKFMYEKGDTTYLQLLLESSGFSDMINKVEYIEKLYEYDRTLLAEYVAARTAAQELKDKLEEEKAELEAQQHELEEEKESLEIILAEKQQTYDNYEVQLAQAKQEAAVYKANIKKQNDEIKKLEAATAAKQSEIDAAKKAEEEARKAQQQEEEKVVAQKVAALNAVVEKLNVLKTQI